MGSNNYQGVVEPQAVCGTTFRRSNWIEVGSALVQQQYVIAITEVSFSKYDDLWSFHVNLASNSERRMPGLHISNKDESYIRKEHAALKNTLRNS